MDDLNGDGVVDLQDAQRLADTIDTFSASRISGGLGVYAKFDDPQGPDTPCVQVDLRGWRERWRQSNSFRFCSSYRRFIAMCSSSSHDIRSPV